MFDDEYWVHVGGENFKMNCPSDFARFLEDKLGRETRQCFEGYAFTQVIMDDITGELHDSYNRLIDKAVSELKKCKVSASTKDTFNHAVDMLERGALD